MLSYVQNQVWNMEDGLLLVYEHRSSLDLDRSINVAENVQCDSTILVRGGYHPVSSEDNFTTTLDEHIKSSGGEFFEERFVHQDLIGGSTEIKVGRTAGQHQYILSKLGIRAFQKLFEMVCLIHNRGYCLNGLFEYKDIRYEPKTGGYFIDSEQHLRDSSKVVNFTPDGYEKDIGALGKVLQRVCEVKFMSSSGEVIYPAYVAHLLRIMEYMPDGAENSDTFKEFLRKHPCMMSPMERQALILQAHTQTIFPPMVLQNKLMLASDGYAMWGDIAELVPEFEAVYNYRCPNCYSNSLMSWLQFCRNFLSHPTKDNKTPRFSMEDVDVALWYHFGELLAAALLCLAACQDVDEGGTWTKVTRK